MNFKKVVINLDRRSDRMNEFWGRYPGSPLEFKRFSAVDGKDFNDSNLSGFKFDFFNLLDIRPSSKRNGVLGCWLSHLALWDELSMSNFDGFIIFEDDAFFVQNFEKEFDDFLNLIDESMSLIYFGGRFQEGFLPANLNSNNLWIKEPSGLYRASRTQFGREFDRTTQGYVITKRGAELLLSIFYEWFLNKKGFPAIDGFLNIVRTRIDSLDIFPHLSWSPMNYKSDI